LGVCARDKARGQPRYHAERILKPDPYCIAVTL
jgi:hypothetical protein